MSFDGGRIGGEGILSQLCAFEIHKCEAKFNLSKIMLYNYMNPGYFSLAVTDLKL